MRVTKMEYAARKNACCNT